MVYEGIVNIQNDTIAVRMEPEQPESSHFDITMDNDDDTFGKFMDILEPKFTPDEEPVSTKSYIDGIKKQGSGAFLTSDTNINDLINLYAQTKPKDQTPFPGLEMPREKGEIVFIETVPNFNGMLNEKIITDRTIEFRYRGRL